MHLVGKAKLDCKVCVNRANESVLIQYVVLKSVFSGAHLDSKTQTFSTQASRFYRTIFKALFKLLSE